MHDSLMKYQSRIPDQQEIIDHFNQQNEWNFYKKGIVNYHFTVNFWPPTLKTLKFLNLPDRRKLILTGILAKNGDEGASTW